MKTLFLEALSGMSAWGKVGLITLTIICCLAVLVSTIAMICSYWHEIKQRAKIHALSLYVVLGEVIEHLEQYNERNDKELKHCREQWWEETKALKTQMPKMSEVIACQLRGAMVHNENWSA